ncbi:MAG: ABC transporter permease subunit [Candidatus Hodarchaeales archaeon]
MELFMMGDLIFMALALLFGIQVIAREVDKGTLDLMLSLPVPRWKIIVEKLLAFTTVSFIYPILVWISAVIPALALNIEFNMIAFLIALFSRWLLLITLASIVILLSVILMDTTKTLGISGLFIAGSFILERFGGLIKQASEETAEFLQAISIFHYLDGSVIMNTVIKGESLPVGDYLVIIGIGIMALILSLLIFQKREFK